LKLTTDRHEASRGLFATAELLVTKFSEMTDADKAMNPKHFGSDPVDIRVRIRINPEIWIAISDHFQLTFRPWRSLRSPVALVLASTK